MRRERGIHFKRSFGGRAAHEGLVFAHRLFRAKLIGERDERFFIFGEQQNAGRVEIKPVRIVQVSQFAFSGPRFAGGDGRVQQRHQVRAGGVKAIRRGQHARGFVEGEQMFILEQNGDFPKLARGGGGEFDGAGFQNKMGPATCRSR